MNFQDQMTDSIQTNAPSIRYEGDLRPEQAGIMQQQAQAMQQMQQQAMMQQQQPQQPMMQQPQGRMPAGRMPAMAMGGSMVGPTIEGQGGIRGLNMPGYNEGGSVEDDANYKGWKKIYETNPDAAAMNEKHAQYLDYYNRAPKAYGGVMGQDGRKQYGIGSWFQEKIMDPIKNNPLTSAAVAAVGANYFDVIPGEGSSKDYLTDAFTELFKKGEDTVRVITRPDGSTYEETIPGKSKAAKVGDFLLSDTITSKALPVIGGLTAGLFSDRMNQSEDIEADRGVGLGIQNVGKAANLLSQDQGMAAGLRFLPDVSTRKYSPLQMAEAYGNADVDPIATANLADGGRAFDIPDYSYKNKMMDPDMMEQIKRLIQGGMGKGMGRGDMEKSVLMRMPDMTMGYAEGGRLDSFGMQEQRRKEISKKLQEINQAMMSAETEELVELMQQAMVLKEQMRQLGASPKQNSEDNVMQAMLRGGSSFEDIMSAPGAESIVDSGYDIYKPDRTGDNYPVEDVSMEEMVSMPNNNNRALMTSGKMDNNFNFSDMMRAGMMRRPSGEVDIPSIRMQGDAGSDMGEATMFEEYDQKAEGGIMETEQSEMLDLGGMEKDYREEGGFVPIGEYEKKDDVPARLSVNEFVFTADAVRGAGDGDIDKGAERLQGIMKQLEQQGKPEGMEMMEVSERLSEVV